MVLPNRFKIVFKTISGVVAGIFLFEQIAWAGDLINVALEEQYKKQSRTFAPDYLKNQQSQAESLVAQKQAIADAITTQKLTLSTDTKPPPDESLDLKGPRGGGESRILSSEESAPVVASESTPPQEDETSPIISVTTAEGDIIHYKDGGIDSVEKNTENGFILIRSRAGLDMVDIDGNLLNAEITYPDASVQIIENGATVSIKTPDETTYYYNIDNLIDHAIDKDGKITAYSYENDETVLANDERECRYDSSGRIKNVLFKTGPNAGRTIEYDNGIILKITESDLSQFIFRKEQTGDSAEVTLAEYIDKNGLKAVYDDTGSLVSIEKDGLIVTEAEIHELENNISILSSDLEEAAQDIIGKEAILSAKQALLNEARSAQEAAYRAYINARNSFYSAQTYFNYSEQCLKQSFFGYNITYTNSPQSLIVYKSSAYPNAPSSTIEYDPSGRIIRQRDSNGITTTYSYSSAEAIRTTTDTFDKLSNLWGGYPYPYSMISGGTLNLRGYSYLTCNNFYAPSPSSYSNYSIDFSLDNVYSKLSIGLNGYIAGNSGISLISMYGRFYLQIGGHHPVPLSYSEPIKLNTIYTVQFEIAQNNVRLYLREKGSLTPAYPQYVFAGYIYNPMFYVRLSSGAAKLDNFSLSQNIIPDPAPNINVLNLRRAIEGLSAAGANYSAATCTYNNALNAASNAFAAYEAAQEELAEAISREETIMQEKTTLQAELDSDSIIFNGFLGKPNTSEYGETIPFTKIVYDADSNIEEITKADGTVVTYEDGLLDSTLGSSYTYIEDPMGGISAISIDRDDINRIYGRYGDLTRITADGVTLDMQNNGVTRIEKADGTIIEDAVFDADNNIISARITKPDGVIATYAGGVLVEAEQPNGSIFYYDAQGVITKLVNNRGITYIYSNIEEGGMIFTIAVAQDQGSITEAEEIVYQKYDSDKKLIQARRKDGTVLSYSYTADSTICSDGKTITTYDEDNNIKRTEVLPTAEDPVSTISEYEYGRIRRVYKGGELIYNYAYEFDDSGAEIAVIEDVETGDFKRYKNELLISVTDRNDLVTSYEYDDAERITISTATYLGRVMNRYTYVYEGDLTIIEDIDGIRRTYNKDNKIVELEEAGRTYRYTYTQAEDGKEISTQELIKVRDDSGSIAYYEGGALESIAKPDGTILSDFVFADNEVLSYTILKGNVKYFVEDGRVIKEIWQDPAYSLFLSLNGADNSRSASDSSLSSHPVTFNGDAHLDTDNKKFGTSALALDGTGDYLTLPDSPDWNFGSGDFTIDCWVYFNDLTGIQMLITHWEDGNNRLAIYKDASNKLGFIAVIGGVDKAYYPMTSAWSASINIWYHIAVVRNGTSLKIYINGVSQTLTETTAIGTNDLGDITGNLHVGAYDGVSHYGVKGWLDEVRISRGIARWTSDFTPPQEYEEPAQSPTLPNGTIIEYNADGFVPKVTEPSGKITEYNYEEDAITSLAIGGARNDVEIIASDTGDILQLASYQDPQAPLLLHLDGANGSTTTSDASFANHPVTFNGNAHIDSMGGMFDGALALDGDGDYVSIPYSPDWSFGTGDFTYECWFNTNSTEQQFLLDCSVYANGGWSVRIAGNSVCVVEGYIIGFSIPQIITLNKWHHIAVSRLGTTTKVFFDGNQIDSRTDTTNYAPNRQLEIGDFFYTYNSAHYSYFNGYIDEVRITKGKALYTNNFTPSNEPGRDPYKTSGSFISNPIEINASRLDSISWNESLPQGTDLTIQTRTGNTVNPDDGSWSAWSDPLTDPDGSAITLPAAKYMQYKVNMTTSDPAKTPQLTSDPALKFLSAEGKTIYIVITKDGVATRYADGEGMSLDSLRPSFTAIEETASEISGRILPEDTVIESQSFKDSEGRDVTIQRTADNKISYLLNDKITQTYQRYDDGHLELLIEYTYDNENNLILVRLPYARDSLDNEITAARWQIAAERANYLRTLAEQRGLAYTQIRDQVESVRDQINAERSRLQPLRYQQVTRVSQGCWGVQTYTETIEVPEVVAALNELDEAERQLNDEEAEAYSALDNEVRLAEERLNQDEASALSEISANENEFQSQIIAEEATPVILECYRSVLGRDPDEAETVAWLATVDYDTAINTELLRTTFFNSEERQTQVAFVAGLKDRIENALYNYLSLDEAGKESLLATLGLTTADCVKLGDKDAAAILSHLDKQNIHFGRSAFVALETLLKDNSIPYNLEDVALNAILIDIFTGSLNPLGDEKLLELSMFALSKTAETYGLTLYNTRLNYDDLTRAFNESGKVIAHLKNNHFVVITDISADGKISYVEHNRGKDGYTWTIPKEEFMDGWTGYAIMKGEGSQIPSWVTPKIISAEKAQRIKGSCLGWLIGLLIGFAVAVTTVVTTVVTAIVAIVVNIAALLAPIISGIGAIMSTVGQFMMGIAAHVFSAISFVGTSLLPAIGSFIGGITGSLFSGLSAFGGAIGNALGFSGLSSLGIALGKTIVITALSFGISRGLEALGVNSTISGLVSAFVTGGVSGLFNTGFSVLSFLTGGLQGLAIQGASRLGTALGVPSDISSVIGLAAGSLIGAGLNGVEVPIFDSETGLQIGTYLTTGLDAISYAFDTRILPSVASELAYIGITRAGELLGVDPRISYAISGFSSSLVGNIVYSIGGDIGEYFNRAVNSAIVSVGVNLLEGVDPAFSVIRSTGLTSALENILNKEGLFNGVFGILNRVASAAFNTAGNIVSDIFSGAKTFIELITDRGPLESVNNALNSLFTRETIEAVESYKGMEEGQHGMETLLAKPMNDVELPDGSMGKELVLSDKASIFFDSSGNIASIKEDGVTCTGTFVWTKDRGIQMKEGTVDGSLEAGYNIWGDVDNGVVKEIKINDIEGNEVVKIAPEKPGSSIGLSSVANSSLFTFSIASAAIYFLSTYIYRINQERVESIEQKVSAISAGSLFNNTNKFLYALANGIRNSEDDPDIAPNYILNLTTDLVYQSNNPIPPDDIFAIPLYQPTTQVDPANFVIDILKWAIDSQTICKKLLSDKAKTKLDEYFYSHSWKWGQSTIGMGYSGGFIPLVDAVSKSVYNVQTIVGLGAASANIKSEFIPVLSQLMLALINHTTDGVQWALNWLGFLDPAINEFIDNLQHNYYDRILPVIKEAFHKTMEQSGSDDTFGYFLPNTDFVVNVWGTKDILYECGLAGKRDTFCSKLTYNIEIVGADHFDYMKGIVPRTGEELDWNNKVAEFCADLVLNSDNTDRVQAFLDDPLNHAVRTGTRDYVVYLPGWDTHQ